MLETCRSPEEPAMSLRHQHSTRRAGRASAFIAALVVGLLAPQMILGAAHADDGDGDGDDGGTAVSAPTSMTVTVQTDQSVAAALAGVPGAALPSVLAAVGTPFTVTVSLWDDGVAAAFPADTVVSLGTTGAGHLTPSTLTIPAGAVTASVSVAYSAADQALRVTATVPDVLPTATSDAFPVELTLKVLSGQSASLKNGTAGADGGGCATVDAAHPICGVLSLPKGAAGNVAVSLGLCPAGQPCAAGGPVTQLIANMDGLYTRTSPARMTLICDKTVCGKAGVPSFRAVWSQSATGDLITTPVCPSKGVIGPNQTVCTDPVSSHRGKGGDLYLVVLFLDDVRGSVGS